MRSIRGSRCVFVGGLALALVVFAAAALGRSNEQGRSPDSVANPATISRTESYVRVVGPHEHDPAVRVPTAWGGEARSIDGTGNNVANPMWGSAGVRFLRLVGSDYADGLSAPAGASRPSPRAISSAVCDQAANKFNEMSASDFVWMWGQFLDHDLDLAGTAAPAEPFDIQVPIGDPFFDPASTGTQVIRLDRSDYDPTTGTIDPREQINFITAYIDASNVYGSDSVRAAALRSNDGAGRLKTSAGNLLPYNTDGLPNAGGTSASLFVAGDVRVNEQIALTALHTLFVREHNRLADEIRAAEPALDDEEIYQRARATVGAQMQVITYKEWLPIVLGPNALPPYTGYDSTANAGVSNFFATASFRVGHTMLSPQLKRLDQYNQPIAEGHLALRDAFFAPTRLTEGGGIEPLFRGAARQIQQNIDGLIIGEVRNFLFGPPGSGGFDLVSLNIQRGREHGLPSYNAARVALGLPAAATYADCSSDPEMQFRLASVYSDMDGIDPWLGGVAEDHVPGALVGELVHAVLVDQFTRARDGDRFWYQLTFSGQMLTDLENTRLSDIIRRNTTIDDEIQDTVFTAGPDERIPTVSQWGLLVLGILLLAGAKIRSRRVQAVLN